MRFGAGVIYEEETDLENTVNRYNKILSLLP
jgi:hypothetical protein